MNLNIKCVFLIIYVNNKEINKKNIYVTIQL